MVDIRVQNDPSYRPTRTSHMQLIQFNKVNTLHNDPRYFRPMLVYHMNKLNPTRVNLRHSRLLRAHLSKSLVGAMGPIPLNGSLRRPSSPLTRLYPTRLISFVRFVATISSYCTKLIFCAHQEWRHLPNCVAHLKEYSDYTVWASAEALCGKPLHIPGISANNAAEGMVNMMRGHRDHCKDCADCAERERVRRVNLIPQYRPPQ